jgi:acyl-CoA thioesterase
MKSPAEILKIMLEGDNFSHWLGIEVLEINLGSCVLKAVVKKEMLNGFSIAHGGISYSLSDSALAFASNSYGFKSVSIETSISHLKKVLENDTLLVSCAEINRGKSIGVYEVKITNQKEELISLFKGIVHISEKIW